MQKYFIIAGEKVNKNDRTIIDIWIQGLYGYI